MIKRLKYLLPLVFMSAVFATRANAESLLCSPQHFSVGADAEIRVKPDRVSVTFGIHERSKDLSKAKERMNRVIKDAIAFCKASGVQDKNIQTAHIGISPYYDNDREDRIVLKHYDLAQSITVVIEDIGKYDDIVFGLLDKGINRLENISFSTSHLREYQDKARLAAIKAAQEKAKLLTKAVGIPLGKPINIHEDSYGGGYPYFSRVDMNSSQNINQSGSGNRGGDDEGIAPGGISIKASVTITYEVGAPR